MPVRSSASLFDCGAGYSVHRQPNKTKAPRATGDNATSGAIVIATSAVVAAEIVIVTNAVAAKIVIVTATNANRVTPPVTPPKKPAMPNQPRSKHLAATQVAVRMVLAAKAVAARVKVKDVVAVGMISVVVSRVVTIAVSDRPRQAPRLLRRLWPLLRPQRRHRRCRLPQPRSWVLQT